MINATSHSRFRLVFLLTCGFLLAQSSTAQSPLVVDANLKRQLVRVASTEHVIRLEHLTPGQTYGLVLPLGGTMDACLPEIAISDPHAVLLLNDPVQHRLRFKALASTLNLTFHYPCEWNATNPAEHYISLTCETCAVKKTRNAESDQAVLEVQQTTVEQLVRDVFVGGDCFDISNVTYKGNATQFASFSNGQTNIGFNTGMLLSTCEVSLVPGPNDLNGSSQSMTGIGYDSDLDSIATSVMFDLTMIEFDFVPTQSPLTFSYAFASEEYCEYVNTQFNDAFGFFISGPGIAGTKNLAVIPSTNTPISVNTVNHFVNSGLYVPNTPPGLDNCEAGGVNGNLPPQAPATGAATHELQFDGFTRKMTAVADVVPCSTYHIKLALADVGDPQRDAAVFFKAGSFDAGGSASLDWVVNGERGAGNAVEGCGTVQIQVDRLSADAATPLPVSFMISGTATSGSDYSSIPVVIVIPAGQDKVLVPVNIVNDLVPEGAETIILTLNNACSCGSPQKILTILDKSPDMLLKADTVSVCAPSGTATVSVSVEGGVGPYSYLWSNGSTASAISVSVDTTTDFPVTVTDACGETATTVARIIISPLPTAQLIGPALSSCLDHSAVLHVFFTGTGPFHFEYMFNGALQPGISGIQNNPYSLVVHELGVYVGAHVADVLGCTGNAGGAVVVSSFSTTDPAMGVDTVYLCSGSSVEIGGNIYTQAGTALDTIATATGCDSIVTYTILSLPLASGADTISFCMGDTIQIAGNMYTEGGAVLDTLVAVSGCDSIVQHTLVQLLSPARAETLSFCPGDTVWVGGHPYTLPGVLHISLPATTGCDTLVTYTLQYLTPAPSTLSINCPNSISVQVNTGSSGEIVTFAAASAVSDCPCPGTDLTQISGLSSGSVFPLGQSQVCFRANDRCGQTATCCFNIDVSEDVACDIKVNGCVKYELLTITEDQFKNKTYRIRVTNNCANELIYTAIQLPAGLVALFPENNSIYTSPGGHDYIVRNPNFSPFYSVRYRSLGGGIANGGSDILRYTLPAQADVQFIHITSRLNVQVFYEAHLNTFNCPVGITPPGERDSENPVAAAENPGPVSIYPNPSEGFIQVDLSAWEGESVQLQVFNSQGQRVLRQNGPATIEPWRIELPRGMADGLYILELSTGSGEKEAVKFVVKH